MELPRRYPYNPRWRVILACAVFFGACAAFMAYKATHNDVGLIINGIITLGPTGATVFYWVIAALGAGFVLLALLLTARRITSPQILEVGTEFFQPRAASNQTGYAHVGQECRLDALKGHRNLTHSARRVRIT